MGIKGSQSKHHINSYTVFQNALVQDQRIHILTYSAAVNSRTLYEVLEKTTSTYCSSSTGTPKISKPDLGKKKVWLATGWGVQGEWHSYIEHRKLNGCVLSQVEILSRWSLQLPQTMLILHKMGEQNSLHSILQPRDCETNQPSFKYTVTSHMLKPDRVMCQDHVFTLCSYSLTVYLLFCYKSMFSRSCVMSCLFFLPATLG